MASQNLLANSVHLWCTSFLLTTWLLAATVDARIGYFWHITDLHLDTIYSTQGDVLRSCWRIERQPVSSSSWPPGHFGDYLCDSPWSLIESAAKAMKSRQGDNVEFVLWTGDGLSRSSHPMGESKRLEILRNITDLLGRTFSSQFVFPVLGHEDGTTNFRHMGELWRHWLPSEALQTFEKGGYYSIEQTKSRLRIIALNTNFMRHDPKYSQSHLAAVRQRGQSGHGDASEYKNFYYHHGNVHQHHGHASGDWMSSSSSSLSSSSSFSSPYNGHNRGIGTIPGVMQDPGNGNGGRVSALSEYENQDTEKQWIWLEDVLSKSKNNKETVYIVGHIPPGSDERHIGIQQNGHTTFTESNNKRYLELVRKYSSIIQGQFFGHLHSDSFRIIYDDKGKPVSWMMISPSVTPRKSSIGSNNPAMRLYKFDTDSGQVLDYTQYYLDLQLANTMGEPNWQPEYNLTHYYGLNDISAISLHNFVDRFTSNDGSWFAKYYRANTVRYQTDPCEGVCLLNHYCAITRVDYKEFRQCLEKERSALTSHAAPPIGAATPTLVLSTTCPMLALLFTLAASCCRSALSLLPRLVGRGGGGARSSSSSRRSSSSGRRNGGQEPARPGRVWLRRLRARLGPAGAGGEAWLQRSPAPDGGDDADFLYCERASGSPAEQQASGGGGHASVHSDCRSDSARFGRRFVGWARLVLARVVYVVVVVVLALGLPVVRILRTRLPGVAAGSSQGEMGRRLGSSSDRETSSNTNHKDDPGKVARQQQQQQRQQQHQQVAGRPAATRVQ